MLKGVSESARQHRLAFSYIPDSEMLLAGGDSEYRLGELIAEGGEGRVYAVKNRRDVVAKIYKELDLDRKKKLQTLVALSSRSLRKVCAWPSSVLSDSTDNAVGFVMESLVGWQPLHSAYQIRSRLKLFPHHTYAFLVHTARNLATCVHHIHESGFVIGDLNESNVFVNPQAMVKLIDADSFQVRLDSSREFYPCKVGKAELMPPELQGHSLDGVIRTEAHDRFALAVLIFQTLVFGRHPFAGITPQHLDLTLETCIAQGYYAYSKTRETPVKPPPHLTLDWLPEAIQELFERSFDPEGDERPSAKQWYFALKSLEASLKTCPENPSHRYWGGAQWCPWCELEDHWRIALFRPFLIDPETEYELDDILARMAKVGAPPETGKVMVTFDYKRLPPAQLRPWEILFGKASRNWVWFVFCSFQVVNVVADRSVPITVFFVLFLFALLVSVVVSGRSEFLVKRASRRLDALSDVWRRDADPALYEARRLEYESMANDLKDVKGRFEQARRHAIEELHERELLQFLEKYSILIANTKTMRPETLNDLEKFGIRTAADIETKRLNTLPRILPDRDKDDLLNWRKQLEAQFWKSHNYKLTMNQERRLIVDVRKENDRRRDELENAPSELETLSARLTTRQVEIATQAERHVAVLRQHGPRLLALGGRKG